jgi:murein DD-endopeptidase MepM/ murein hydrolase activator NlpD
MGTDDGNRWRSAHRPRQHILKENHVLTPSRVPLRLGALALALSASGGAFAQAIDINVVAPNRDDNIVFQRIAPSEVGGPYQARVVLRMGLHNTTAQPVKITKVEILDQLASNFLTPVEVQPGGQLIFENCNCNYDKVNDDDPDVPKSYPTVIDAPYPSVATVKVYLQGVRFPITETISISSYTNDGGPLLYPAKISDLRQNEAWGTSSNHVGFSQAYGLDASVAGWDEGIDKWNFLYPGSDDTKATQHRAYGQPLYAMTDGIVCSALNDQPEWKNYPRVDKTIEPEPIPPSTGVYSAGGNHLKVLTGGEVTLYAHMQPGSIPEALLTPGAIVKQGQYLGKVGYSGQSSGPHIHIHVSQESDGEPCTGIGSRPRPMQFKQMQSLTRGEANVLSAADDMQPSDWADLTNHSAPHKQSLLYPATTNYAFDKDATDNRQILGVWRSGSHIELRVNVQGWSAMIAKRNDLAKSDFRLLEVNTYVENGKRHFVGLFRHVEGGGNEQGLSLLKDWASFTAHRDALEAQGLRLADVTYFHDGVSDNFVGVFLPGSGDQQTINTGNWITFAAVAASFATQGLRLVDVESYATGGGQQYVGVFRPGTGTQLLVRSPSWTQFKLDWSAQSDLGQRLTDVETVVVNGVRQYIGVFRQGGGGHAMELRNGYNSFFQGAEQNNAKGLRLVDIHVLQ